MKRWFAAFGCALTLAVALPVGSAVKADGVYHRAHAYAPAAVTFTRKRCLPPARDGVTPASWICSAAEKCCYDFVFRRGTCVASTDRCL